MDQIYYHNLENFTDQSAKDLIENKKIHPLIFEDIKNNDHKSKFDILEDTFFIILKSPFFKSDKKKLSFINCNLIFHQGDFYYFSNSDAFIKSLDKRMNFSNAKYFDSILYHFVDFQTDQFFPIIDEFKERLHDLEDKITYKKNENALHKIHQLHREINRLNQILSNLKEIIAQLTKNETPPLKSIDREAIRDLVDHAHHLFDEAKLLKEEITLIYNLFYSHLNIKMNASMKTLSQVATVMMPLSLIAGIYGMNFKNMPELDFTYGYFIVLGFIFILGIALWLYIRKK